MFHILSLLQRTQNLLLQLTAITTSNVCDGGQFCLNVFVTHTRPVRPLLARFSPVSASITQYINATIVNPDYLSKENI